MTLWVGGIATAIILAASFLFAMLGLGGGMVYVPLLHWLGFDLKTVAIPLGLLLNGLTTLLALISYSRERLVDWKGGWPMGLAAVVGAPLGALAVPYVSRPHLLAAFATVVVLAATRMLWTAGRPEPPTAALGSFPPLLTGLAVGAVLVGAQGGARFMMARARPGWIKRAYAVVLLVIAARLTWEVMAGLLSAAG